MVTADTETGLCPGWGKQPVESFSVYSLLCELAELAGSQKLDRIPKWYQIFSLIFAVLIIISTQVLKQHYLVDAIAGVALVELAWRFYNTRKPSSRFPEFF